MKRVLCTIGFIIIFTVSGNAQSVGISSTAITPDPYSLLELRTNAQGVMLPRLSNLERAALTSSGLGTAQQGLTIYNKDTDLYNYWDGTTWVVMSTSTGSYIDNQNTGIQTADFVISGKGVTSSMGVGVGMGLLNAKLHVQDDNTMAGNQLVSVEDFVGNPLLSVFDVGNIGVGTNAPAASAIVDIQANGRGILLPRMITVDRTTFGGTLGLTDEGMTVFDIDLDTYYFWDGTTWRSLITSSTFGSYIENQVAVLQTADYRIAGTGVASQIGIGTGLGAILASNHIHDDNSGAGNLLFLADDFVGNPIMTIYDTGQIGVATNTPNGNSVLDIQGNKGVLLPRMTTAQKNTYGTGLGAAEAGMMVFDLGDNQYYWWDGTAWTGGGTPPGTFIDNQNTAQQVADFNVGGLGVINKLGVGTALGPVTGLAHFHDNSSTAGSRLLFVDDFVGNPIMMIKDVGNIGLGTTAPAGSAQLDMTSTNKGFLPPRMTAVQRLAIAAPVQGLIVYQITTPGKGLWLHDGGAWQRLAIATSSITALLDLDGDTKVEVEQSTDEDIIRFITFGTEYMNMDAGRLNVTNTGESVFIGQKAGKNDDLTNNRNVFIGEDAGRDNTSGYYNTHLGYRAGYLHNTGYDCTYIGASTNGSGIDHNSMALGFAASTTTNNEVVIGNSSITSIGGYAAWSNLSDGRCKQNIQGNVPGLEFITKLHPVTYNMDLEALANIKKTPDSLRSLEDEKEKEKIIYTGLIAQEVENAANEVNYDFSGIDRPANNNDHYSLRYAEFVTPLIKAVQELSEMNRDMKREIEVLRKQVALIER